MQLHMMKFLQFKDKMCFVLFNLNKRIHLCKSQTLHRETSENKEISLICDIKPYYEKNINNKNIAILFSNFY